MPRELPSSNLDFSNSTSSSFRLWGGRPIIFHRAWPPRFWFAPAAEHLPSHVLSSLARQAHPINAATNSKAVKPSFLHSFVFYRSTFFDPFIRLTLLNPLFLLKPPTMSDPGRKDISTKTKEGLMPNIFKSRGKKMAESATDSADRAAR